MRVTVLCLCLLFCGCFVQRSFVEADRATYDAIAPEYVDYVERDASLSVPKKVRRIKTVKAWDARLTEAEGE